MKQTTKAKPIDLGALQDQFVTTQKQLLADAKAFVKAQDAFDRSKTLHQQATEALKAGARAALD